jgi:hypothetical protein
MEAEVEYTALVTVKLDLESGDVVSTGVRAVTDDESPAAVSVTLEGETDQVNSLPP